MSVKAFLEDINIKVIRGEGDDQLLCACSWCAGDKLYVYRSSGRWD